MVLQICLHCQHIWHKWHQTDANMKYDLSYAHLHIKHKFEKVYIFNSEGNHILYHTHMAHSWTPERSWSDKNCFYFTLLFQIHNVHPSRIDNIFVTFLAAIYLTWGFQTWRVFIDINQCGSFSFQGFWEVNMRLNMYNPAAWFETAFCFCYWSMPKLSEALHGLVFHFTKECYNADTLLCVSYWASFTAENYCYDKNHILITPVFPHTSLNVI